MANTPILPSKFLRSNALIAKALIVKVLTTRTLLIPALIITLPLASQAQTIYKWQNEDGKWQFSDTPPSDGKTAVEQSDPTPVNTSSNTNREMNKVFPRQTSAEIRYENQQQKAANQRTAAIAQWCKQARRRLGIIEGKVVFLDEQGRALEVTEEEREARAIALRKKISKNCP